jgi:hypothetical protein
MQRLLFIVCGSLLISCAASKDSKKSNDAAEFTKELRKYEATFQPSDYNPDVTRILKEEKESTSLQGDVPVEQATEQPAELLPGFRVQIFSSTSIDEANSKLAEVQGILPLEWFYLVYDPPAYKIRGGNFLTRFEAEKFAKQLSDRGYRDAWVVPEKVFKNPPPRPLSSEEDQSGRK